MGVLRMAGTLFVAAAAFSGYAAYRNRHGVMSRHGLPRKPEPLQRWEGEGGAVPTVKATRTKTPVGRTDDLLEPTSFNDPPKL